MQSISRSTTCLLFELQPLNDGSQLAQNFVGLLVVLGLRLDELGEVAQGLGGIEDLENGKAILLAIRPASNPPPGSKSYILHHPNRLLRLRDKLILRPLNLLLGLIAQLMVIERSSVLPSAQLPGRSLDAGLDGIECQPRLLDTLAGARGE